MQTIARTAISIQYPKQYSIDQDEADSQWHHPLRICTQGLSHWCMANLVWQKLLMQSSMQFDLQPPFQDVLDWRELQRGSSVHIWHKQEGAGKDLEEDIASSKGVSWCYWCDQLAGNPYGKSATIWKRSQCLQLSGRQIAGCRQLFAMSLLIAFVKIYGWHRLGCHVCHRKFNVVIVRQNGVTRMIFFHLIPSHRTVYIFRRSMQPKTPLRDISESHFELV